MLFFQKQTNKNKQKQNKSKTKTTNNKNKNKKKNFENKYTNCIRMIVVGASYFKVFFLLNGLPFPTPLFNVQV